MTRLWPWVKTLGGIGILGLLLWRLGTAAFLDGLRVIDGPALLTAFAIGVLTTVCSAWRWCLVARGLGLRLPLSNAVADYYRALFLNAALPGGVLGDVHRAVRHGRDVGDVSRGVRAVVLERTAGQIMLGIVGVTVLFTVPASILATLLPATVPWAGTAVVAALGIAVAVAIRLGLRRPASWWGRTVRTAVSDIRVGLLARGVWPGVLVSSAVVLAGHVATFVVAARVAGSTAPLTQLVPLMLLALLAMVIPLSVGGWGPREGAAAWAFGAAGLGAAQGLTTAVVYGLFAFAASLPGAGVLTVRWINRVRAGRAQATSPAVKGNDARLQA